jgi:hypothetical protein
MATPPLPDSTTTCVPYPQATPRQLALALTYVMEELAQHFPTLSFASWANALLQQQPDLWVEQEEVLLEEDDLTRLTQRLAASPELPQLRPPIYPDQACYLARRLVNYQDQALCALTEIEAAPHAFGYRVYALVLDLAAGNGIAQQVYRVTHRQPSPGRRDPAAARLAASDRVAAVRRARGELAYALTEPATAIPAAAPPSAEAGQQQ